MPFSEITIKLLLKFCTKTRLFVTICMNVHLIKSVNIIIRNRQNPQIIFGSLPMSAPITRNALYPYGTRGN